MFLLILYFWDPAEHYCLFWVWVDKTFTLASASVKMQSGSKDTFASNCQLWRCLKKKVQRYAWLKMLHMQAPSEQRAEHLLQEFWSCKFECTWRMVKPQQGIWVLIDRVELGNLFWSLYKTRKELTGQVQLRHRNYSTAVSI